MSKVAGKDSFFAEILRYGDDHSIDIICRIFLNTWNAGRV